MNLINYRCELLPPILNGAFSNDNWVSQTKFYFHFQYMHKDTWVYQVASLTNADDYSGAYLEVSCIVHYMYKGEKPLLEEALDLAHKAVSLMNQNINREILHRVNIAEQDIIIPFTNEAVAEEISEALAEAYK